jgi:predicted phage baseplate assembly protein
MALPAPNLDDRRFQDLVDDAKRLVMQRCPEWTDHNVSDPGVTLIETFAYIADQLLYRLNRVPDRLYIKFLELLGVRLFAATPARAPLTFWLAMPAEVAYPITIGTQASTLRTDAAEAVTFTTIEDLTLVPASLGALYTQPEGSTERTERKDQMLLGNEFPAFADHPQPGDALLVGLTDAVPRCAIRLQFECRIDGVGVDPDNPPLAWEAWDGVDWQPCEVDHDDTGGLNRNGEVVIHVPASHTIGVFENERGGWIRARVTEADEGQPQYSSAPIIHSLVADTIGGTIDAVNAEVVTFEPIGESEGVPGQHFFLQRSPVLTGLGRAVLESTSDEGWQEWHEVDHFAESGDDQRHFILDAVHGEIVLGPAVREADGSVRQFGWVPPKGGELRMRTYTVGGGRGGNVARGTIRVLESSLPGITSVENRYPALGGVDGEDLENAKNRGPIMLRTRSRAVTTEDYEFITRQAAPEVARVRAVPAGNNGVEPGAVKVLIMPSAPSERGRINFEDLVPGTDTFERIKDRLDETRLVGTRILVEPPLYRGVTVVARLRARPRSSATRIRDDALDALHGYLNPITGGPEGTGWPFGRPVQAGEVYAVLQRIKGVDLVEDVKVFGANPVTGERGSQTQRLELEPDSLVFSYEHQVRVEEAH